MKGLALWVAAATLFATPSVSPQDYPSQWKNKGKGRTFVLYRRHNVSAMSQGPVGSCVGTATAKALELMHGHKFSAEWCYGAPREYFNANPRKAGSHCGWAAQTMVDYGAVPCRNYPVIGYNLTTYDPAIAYLWQRGPPPAALRHTAAKYKSPGCLKIDTWDQLRDCIAQGIPVICGSSVGFGSRRTQVRSRSGMLHSKWWSKWNHAMVICGVSDGKSKRALLLNSWGTNWIKGPKWLGDEPNGSFWISKRDAQKILSYDDCWAILPLTGIRR